MSSIVKVDTIQENTSANGITVDGLNIKDSKLVTANSVVTANITDANITAAKLASGVLPTNTPYFYGEKASNTTISRGAFTKVTGLTQNELDSASAFDGTTFTVPSGQGGKYYLEGVVTGDYQSIGEDGENTLVLIRKNSSYIKSAKIQQGGTQNMREVTVTASGIFTLSASDTIELYAYLLDASGGTADVQSDRTSLMGYKIIE